MFGAIYGGTYSPQVYWSVQNTQQAAHISATAAARAENTSIPVQPVPAAREVISADDKFSIESLLNQHDSDPVGMAVRMRIQYPSAEEKPVQPENSEDTKSAQEVVEESKCQTCEQRKYKDGSDDPGVSFKTATKLSPEEAATAVRGHEMEHVVRNQAKAQREDRKVVSQSVTIHTDICPECGDVYTSGGTTRTVTKANSDNNNNQQDAQQQPSSAVA